MPLITKEPDAVLAAGQKEIGTIKALGPIHHYLGETRWSRSLPIVIEYSLHQINKVVCMTALSFGCLADQIVV